MKSLHKNSMQLMANPDTKDGQIKNFKTTNNAKIATLSTSWGQTTS